MATLTATAKQWFDDLITGADHDDPVVFLVKITLPNSTVLYSQMGRPPGYRKTTSHAEALPDLILPSLSMSIMNRQPVRIVDGVRQFQQFTVGDLTYGQIVFANAYGQKNAWADCTYKWSDADGELMIGTMSTAQTSFETFMPFKVAGEPGWQAGQGVPSLVLIQPQPAHVNLNLEAQDEQFAGTGGLEGDATVEGLPKPRLFGRGRGEPVMVDNSNKRYLISSEAIDTIPDVVVGGDNTVAFTPVVASGYFDLSANPDGTVTYLAQGEKVNAGVYSADAADIMEYWIETLWGGTITGETAYATDLSSSHTWGMPWNPNKSLTRAAALDWMLRPLGLGYIDQDGSAFKIQVLKEPSTQTASVAFTDDDIVSVTCEPAPPPVWRVAMGYRERVPTTSFVTVTPYEKQFYSSPRDYKTDSSATVKTNYPSALDVTVPSPLAYASDASTLATTFLGVYDSCHWLYRVRLGRRPMHAWVGDYVSLQSDVMDNLPGLSTAKKVLVTGIRLDFNTGSFEMECWG